MLELLQQIQGTWLSRAISESIWGYPIVGALHVLAVALFGGTLLVSHLSDELRALKAVGLTMVLTTGVLLFAAGAVGYSDSVFFRIKLVLLVLIAVNALQTRFARIRTRVSLILWVAVIFASRGTAFL
jgi:hypothetical protein